MKRLKIRKNIVISIFIILVLAILIGVPSFARLRNRNTIQNVEEWDGTVATSYKRGDGTSENPYVISNGSEFAFFIEQLKQTNYEGTYFELSNDIIINSGSFNYNDSSVIEYIKDSKTYYIKPNTNEYYGTSNYSNAKIGELNKIEQGKEFKGSFNGNAYTIYGLIISSKEEGTISLFENFSGKISDLYLDNYLINGKGNIATIAINSNGGIIQNVVTNGSIINNSDLKEQINNMDDITYDVPTLGLSTNLELSIPEITGNKKSIVISGNYEFLDQTATNNIKINGIELKEGNFEINLTSSDLTNVVLDATTTIDNKLTLSNLKLSIKYYDDISSGFFINSSNSNISNSINKSLIYGKYLTTGFISNVNETLEIKNSYNTGKIKSENISSGVLGLIENNNDYIKISNVYNKGEITGTSLAGIVALINNSQNINIESTINASNNYFINTINNSTVNINTSYTTYQSSLYSGSTSGSVVQKSLSELYNSNFMKSLGYNEFIDENDLKENNENIWIYEKDSLPILYIDDLNNPVAILNIDKYNWNNLSYSLNTLKIDGEIKFRVAGISEVTQIDKVYYFVTSSVAPITKTELNNINDWSLYEDVVTISDTGYHVIYIKIIDTNGNISYINSDILALNITTNKSNFSYEDIVWDEYNSTPSTLYTNEKISIFLNMGEESPIVSYIQYFISNEILNEEQLNIVEWKPYTSYINVLDPGKYIIYAKIVDINNNYRYINTDIIEYKGYHQELTLGNKNNNYDTLNITNNSSIRVNFKNIYDINLKDNNYYALMTNMLLPKGTNLTLINDDTKDVYKYNIEETEDIFGYEDSCSDKVICTKYASYKLSNFKKVGISNEYYNDSKNIENYTIYIDFSESEIASNYENITFKLALKNSSDKIVYDTLSNTLKNINIYSNIDDASLEPTQQLITNYNDQSLYYNSESELNVNLTNQITYSKINNLNIIDTSLEQQKYGLQIKLLDSNNTMVDKKYLDNMIFEVNGKQFFAGNDGIVKINVGNIGNLETKTLKIKTKNNASSLTNGAYSLKINYFISNDGYINIDETKELISIPIIVTDQSIEINNYNYNIELLSEKLIFDKKLNSDIMTFDVIYNGNLINPNILVSLYKKDKLTAYDQSYTQIDLKDYVSDTLINYSDKKYVVNLSQDFSLNLIPNKFDSNGYKLVFELYGGDIKATQIEKYFIVK